MSFNWNQPQVKSRFWNAEIGNAEIKMFSPIEITKNPNYHQPEAIMSAICKVVSELAQLEEERTARMLGVFKNPNQMSLFEEKEDGNETVS